MYVILMLLLINFSTTSYSETNNDNSNAEVWQALATSLGTTLQGLATTNQAATMAALTQQIAELDEELINSYGVSPSKCGSECKSRCCDYPDTCKKYPCTYYTEYPRSTAACVCQVDNTDTVDRCGPPMPIGPSTGSAVGNSCSCTRKCTRYDECDKKCKARKKLNAAKYLNWNTLLSLAGIAATTAATALQPEEEKRTCAEKCAGLSGKELNTCLKDNTNEYGESCDYTPPAGRCDETDPIIKDKTCEEWDGACGLGGCAFYTSQCECTLRAEQTKQPYAWNMSKCACLLQTEGGGEDGTAKAGDDIAVGDDKDAKAKDEEKAKALAGGAGSALSSKGSGATAPTVAGKKAPQVKDPKKASLGDTAGGAFKDQNYMGMVGESGGTQGEGASSSKKATDIASSKTAETLLDMIHTTYTGYTDAGRFLSADVKVEKGKTKDSKRIKRKG